MAHLFFFGFGYTAQALARRVAPRGWRMTGTTRKDPVSGARDTQSSRPEPALLRFDGGAPVDDGGALAHATHILISVPPDEDGCPVLRHHAAMLARSRRCRWLGYLSTTGVYGDRGGRWVDESDAPRPTGDRSARRLNAETAWRAFGIDSAIPVHVFRLAGIYGPRRSALDRVRAPDARIVDAPGHFFSRVHVDDIAALLLASMDAPGRDEIYNAADDEPSTQRAVMEEAARLLGIPPPPLVTLEDADLSPMARSFWADNRRVRNERMKALIGGPLLYPTYREGLRAILEAERGGRSTG